MKHLLDMDNHGNSGLPKMPGVDWLLEKHPTNSNSYKCLKIKPRDFEQFRIRGKIDGKRGKRRLEIENNRDGAIISKF